MNRETNGQTDLPEVVGSDCSCYILLIYSSKLLSINSVRLTASTP